MEVKNSDMGEVVILDGEHLAGLQMVTTQTCQEKDPGVGWNLP